MSITSNSSPPGWLVLVFFTTLAYHLSDEFAGFAEAFFRAELATYVRLGLRSLAAS